MATAGAAAEPPTYVVDPARSQVRIQVGRAGLFSFAGHAHEVLAPRLEGRVVADPAQIAASTVELLFESGALRVSGRGEPAEDVPKVQARMLGPDVLNVARFPSVSFRSTGVTGRRVGVDAYELQVAGRLSLHGVERELKLPVRVVVAGNLLTASGSWSLKQSQYGIEPISVAGVVKVKDDLTIDFTIVAAR